MLKTVSPGVVNEVAPLSLYLLGGFRLVGQGADDHSLDNRHNVRAVLALVGSRTQGIGRDELIEMLWPDAAAAQGRNRLYHTAHLARQALSALAWDDEWLVIRQSRVLLDQRVWCDARQLSQVLERDGQALSNDALDALAPLCRGEWVPGLLPGKEGDADRARVRQAQAIVLRCVVERNRAQGDTHGLRSTLRRLLDLETTDEWAYRESMQLDSTAGRHHAVLHTFEKLSQQLASRLGLKPSAASLALRDAARLGLETNRAEWPSRSRSQPVVGREALIQSLITELGTGGGLWNLCGPSGIGKTTVAREVARRMQDKFPDGLFVVNLGDLAATDAAARVCAQALGIATVQGQDDIAMLDKAMRTRHMLLILDDLDVANGAADLLAALPRDTVSARVVITTRAPISAPVTRVVRVLPLQGPAQGATEDRAVQSPAFTLFELRCPVAGPERTASAWRADAVRLVRYLEGSPLAIELAAARTATMTPGEIHRQIAHGLHPLADGPLDLQDRHRSVKASLDWSVKLLSPQADICYQTASVFRTAFERGDAVDLFVAVGIDPAVAEAALGELTAAGLVTVASGERLRMLHLPRSHARDLARRQGRWGPAASAWSSAICRRFAAAPLRHESPDYMANWHTVASLEDDAVAMLEHTCFAHPERSVQLLVGLCEVWRLRGSVDSILQHVVSGIERAAALDLPAEELQLRTALVFARRIRFGAVRSVDDSAALLALLGNVADTGLIARAIDERAISLGQSGRLSEAISLLTEAVNRFGLSPDRAGYWTLRARSFAIGMPAGPRIDVTALRRRFAGSNLWIDLLRAAHADSRHGVDWQSSFDLANEMVECSRAVPSLSLLAAMWSRGISEFGLDDISAGMRSFEEAYRLTKSMGLEDFGADCCIYLATWSRYSLDLDAALRWLSEVDRSNSSRERDAFAVMRPLQLAAVSALAGKPAEAVAWLRATDPGRLRKVRDTDLARWAEVAALVARAAGHVERSDALALALRHFDALYDFVPVVRRFRDRQFGLGIRHFPPDAAEREALREALRTMIDDTCKSLPETFATADHP